MLLDGDARQLHSRVSHASFLSGSSSAIPRRRCVRERLKLTPDSANECRCRWDGWMLERGCPAAEEA